MIMMMVAMMAWYSISMAHVTNPTPLIHQEQLTSPVWAEQAAWQGRCPAHAPLSIFPPQQRLDLLHIRACTAHNPAHNYRCLCHQGCQSWVITRHQRLLPSICLGMFVGYDTKGTSAGLGLAGQLWTMKLSPIEAKRAASATSWLLGSSQRKPPLHPMVLPFCLFTTIPEKKMKKLRPPAPQVFFLHKGVHKIIISSCIVCQNL